MDNADKRRDQRAFTAATGVKRWTREDEQALCRMLDGGFGVDDIADALQRTASSVAWYIRNSGIEFTTEAARRTAARLRSARDREKRVYCLAAQIYVQRAATYAADPAECFRLAEAFADEADRLGY